MKILHCVHLFPPAQGGIEHHTMHLTKWLAALGEEVTVVTSGLKDTKLHEIKDKVNIHRYFSIKFPLFSAARFIPFLCWRLYRENADIYCSHGYGSPMPFFTAIAAWLRKKPFVFTLHGYPKQKGVGKIFQMLYRYLAASVFLRIASKVIVVSRTSIQDIEKEVDLSKIVYVPNGIESEEFQCGDFTKNKKIVYAGRLDRDKRIDMLIRAFSSIKKKFPDVELVITGPDEGVKKELEGLARKLGVNVRFTNVPYEKIHEIYCNSAAVVLPSRYEGFSLVWLEAMASGRAMFSTPVGEAPKLFEQVYGDKKELFLFNEEKELEAKLLAFFSNADGYKKIVQEAENIVKAEYSWENVASITRRVYEEALKN